jgi:membrane protein implicated in regulation of membrane protease activity
MDAGLIWILGGLALLGAELLLPGVFLLWIGLAAIGTGLVLLAADPGLAATVVVFIVLLVAGIAAGLRLRRREAPVTGEPNLPGAGLLGREGSLLPHAGPGFRVRIGDSDWPARLAPGVAAEAAIPGALVRVRAVEGMTLVVAPLSHPPPGE